MKTVKKRSQLQEKDVAKNLNAKTVVASGAMWNAKGDVRSGKFLIECKTTEKEYYSVSSKVWEKIEEEATKDHGRTPLLIIDIEDKDRLVVYSPMYFNCNIKVSKSFLVDSGKKSFRVSLKLIEEVSNETDDPTTGIEFSICGKKLSVLMFMKFEDFIKAYDVELQ